MKYRLPLGIYPHVLKFLPVLWRWPGRNNEFPGSLIFIRKQEADLKGQHPGYENWVLSLAHRLSTGLGRAGAKCSLNSSIEATLITSKAE